MNSSQEKSLIQAAYGHTTSRTPIWFLRQAGRYLPEYQEIRAQMSFLELCRDPQKAAEVTLQPLLRFDLDAAIIFSDILIPPTVMGQDLTFDKGHGPRLAPPIRSAEDVKNLKIGDIPEELSYVGQAIKETKKGLKPHQTMIGFAGAPFTVASYMIEGAGSKNYTHVKEMMFGQPKAFSQLLDQLVATTIEYLEMQISFGAETVMLFDSWAGNLSDADYRQWIVPTISKLAKQITSVPVIYYPGQHHIDALEGLEGVDVVAIDWRYNLPNAVETLKNQKLDVSIQGNLDPQVLMASESVIQEKVRAILQQGENARGHIFNVGHGLLPHIPPQGLKTAIAEIRKWDQEKYKQLK
ncbi:MAG: uroporphyrinogen decarboxylase [Oligoflexales bacterium]